MIETTSKEEHDFDSFEKLVGLLDNPAVHSGPEKVPEKSTRGMGEPTADSAASASPATRPAPAEEDWDRVRAEIRAEIRQFTIDIELQVAGQSRKVELDELKEKLGSWNLRGFDSFMQSGCEIVTTGDMKGISDKTMFDRHVILLDNCLIETEKLTASDKYVVLDV